MNKEKSAVWLIGVVIAFCCYVFLAITHAGVDPHAIAYAGDGQWYDIARNINIIMHIADDWTRYSLIDMAYYKHPPLFFYMSAVSYWAGGETALLLFMNVISLGAIIATYFYIKELYGKEAAAFTVLLLSFSPALFDTSFHVMFGNGTLLFFSLCSLIMYKAVTKNSWGYTILGGLAIGLMLLYKTVLVIIYPGVGLFILLTIRRSPQPQRYFLTRSIKLLSSFLVSCAIFSPWVIYLRLNEGGYDWFAELVYNLPWQKDLVVSPWHYYFSQAPDRMGWVWCGFVLVGLGKFFSDVKSSKKKQDIFLFSLSLAYFFVFFCWTLKAFRFLLPVFPFFMYGFYLGVRQVFIFIKKAFPLKPYEGIVWAGLMIFAVFALMIKNSFVFKSIPDESPYKLAAHYIKQKGLTSDCYLSDERILFQTYMNACSFWAQPNLRYNIGGIVGHDIDYAVIQHANKPFVPVKKLIKSFQGNNKNVGLYEIDQKAIDMVKKRDKGIIINIQDKGGKNLKGVFVYLYSGDDLFLEGRTNAQGVVHALTYGEKPLSIRIEAWNKIPVSFELRETMSNILVKLDENTFFKNGVFTSTF